MVTETNAILECWLIIKLYRLHKDVKWEEEDRLFQSNFGTAVFYFSFGGPVSVEIQCKGLLAKRWYVTRGEWEQVVSKQNSQITVF